MGVSCQRHFFLVLLLNQRWSPPFRLQASHCSTFRIMCDVPSIAVFCNVFSSMHVKHHNTSFIFSRLHRIRLFNFFPFSCPNPMLGGLWDGPCWVSSVWFPFSSVLSEDLCSFLLLLLLLLLLLMRLWRICWLCPDSIHINCAGYKLISHVLLFTYTRAFYESFLAV